MPDEKPPLARRMVNKVGRAEANDVEEVFRLVIGMGQALFTILQAPFRRSVAPPSHNARSHANASDDTASAPEGEPRP